MRQGEEEEGKESRVYFWTTRTAMYAVEWPVLRASVRNPCSEGAVAPPLVSSSSALRLASARTRVPRVRAVYGARAWNIIVNPPFPSRLPSGRIPVSRAYHKMVEMQRSCVLGPTSKTLFLCEAPGGFVQAVEDGLARRPEWQWVAFSSGARNAPLPMYEHLPLGCGEFVMGDIMDAESASDLAQRGPFDLVTADGAILMDHDYLEQAHLPLFRRQVEVALCCLSKGGTLIVKFFEGNLRETRVCIAWLTTRFTQTSIIKPTASRPTNSERYIVARGFTGGEEEEAGSEVAWRTSDEWNDDLAIILDSMADDQSAALELTMSKLSRLPQEK